MIEGDSELKKIIIQLWKSQGNVSTTAKSLYMHRNTLINKIEKYFLDSDLNLKNMDDLFFCYLLIQYYSK
ncbi:hypothetical protein FEW58_000670 [Enterococcus faecalis]|uniref:helix-turn-helix domain-containing protein n=1 Tax=Enterococcus malodoratus TaxID=71451 RepID=UPI000B810997|nr:hypothetical protein [Enterococcus faecalis]EIY8109117.1 helix-turn-helix domain-containing protein [Enterococcus faecalis]EKQ3637157.1 helix-turn-helix domain-containing protein [Enterococcus faecalis]